MIASVKISIKLAATTKATHLPTYVFMHTKMDVCMLFSLSVFNVNKFFVLLRIRILNGFS